MCSAPQCRLTVIAGIDVIPADHSTGRATNVIMWGTSAISIFFVFVPAPLIVIAGTAAHALFP